MEGGTERCPLSPTHLNVYLGDLIKNCFLNTGGVNIGGRRIKHIKFAYDMALLVDDERMLNYMLMELKHRREDYEMKIHVNKTKGMHGRLAR